MPIPLTLPTLGNAYSQDLTVPGSVINYGAKFVEIIGNSQYITANEGYDSASATLFAAMSVQPNSFNKGVINSLIRRLKTDLDLTKASTNWNEMDALVVLAQDSVQGEQAALLNWKNPGTFNATKVNSPVWAAKQGYSGSSSANNSYLRTNFIPSTNGSKYAQQNCCIFFYNRNVWTTNAPYQVAVGNYDGTNSDQVFITYIAPDFLDGVLHATGVLNSGRNDGFISAVNKGDQTALYRNGVLLGYANIVSNNAKTTRELYVLARNNQGTADLHATNAEIALYGIASAKLDQLRLNAVFQDYMKQLNTAV